MDIDKISNQIGDWWSERSQNWINTSNKLVSVMVIFGIFISSIVIVAYWQEVKSHQIILSLTGVAILLLSLFIGLRSYRRKKARNLDFLFGFVFHSIFVPGIDTDYFKFTESDRLNFNRLINYNKPISKIVWRIIPKNKADGDIRALFNLLHLIVEGGLVDIENRKSDILNFISAHFRFEKNEIKQSSIKTSYPKWKKKMKDGGYSDELKKIRIALDLKSH